jgi:hypothetical protein
MSTLIAKRRKLSTAIKRKKRDDAAKLADGSDFTMCCGTERQTIFRGAQG